ncbi:class I SAM-dependent methyltransferase [bacterium]|nr:class I SAM-dependent methyltransferase [bacterium]
MEDALFEIDRPHGAGRLYNYLLQYKFENAVKRLPFEIKGLKLLDICCGSGMVSEYYAGRGSTVTGIDFSEDAVACANQRKEKYKFQAEFDTGDAQNLPFQDNSFDIVSVHDGLHHLKDAAKAVKEMVRVARKGIIIIEPAKSLLTEISILLGISLRYEGPDFVYRLEEKETRQWLEKAGFKKVFVKRYIMYYPHKPGIFFKILGLPMLFQLYKFCFVIGNALFGRLGNKIQIIGLK